MSRSTDGVAGLAGQTPVTVAGVLRVAMAVYGDITHDSRVQREAIALAEAGHTVTLLCLAGEPGSTTRLHPRIRVVPLVPGRTTIVPGTESPFLTARPAGRARRLRQRLSWLVGYARNLRAWGGMSLAAAGAVDVWHLHDFTALVALAPHLRRRVPFVYDVHDLFTETGTGRRLPGPLRRLARSYERRLARRSALLVAVNNGVAADLRRRLAPTSLIVVHNAAPRWEMPNPRPDLIRQALGLHAGTPVILYHGLLSRNRGLERLCEAMLEPQLEHAHLALLGYGSLRDDLLATAAEARFAGRVHLLDAVAPDALLPWVASADVGALAMPPATRNLVLSTPNKLFECLAAGTPPVVSDFPLVRKIVMDDPAGPLGATCDPSDTRSVAAALAGILGLDQSALDELRSRCRTAARDRWSWESEVGRLVAAYEGLAMAGRVATSGTLR